MVVKSSQKEIHEDSIKMCKEELHKYEIKELELLKAFGSKQKELFEEMFAEKNRRKTRRPWKI